MLSMLATNYLGKTSTHFYYKRSTKYLCTNTESIYLIRQKFQCVDRALLLNHLKAILPNETYTSKIS